MKKIIIGISVFTLVSAGIISCKKEQVSQESVDSIAAGNGNNSLVQVIKHDGNISERDLMGLLYDASPLADNVIKEV